MKAIKILNHVTVCWHYLYLPVMLKLRKTQKSIMLISEDLQVYYFHISQSDVPPAMPLRMKPKWHWRCFMTDQVKDGNIDFTSLNLEEEDGKKMAEQLTCFRTDSAAGQG